MLDLTCTGAYSGAFIAGSAPATLIPDAFAVAADDLPAANADAPDVFGAVALLAEVARAGVLVECVLGKVALVEVALVESATDGATGTGAAVVCADS